MLSGSICSQHAIELILVSQNTCLESDSNDSRIMCILCKTKKLSILFTFLSEHEQSIEHPGLLRKLRKFNFELLHVYAVHVKVFIVCIT